MATTQTPMTEAEAIHLSHELALLEAELPEFSKPRGTSRQVDSIARAEQLARARLDRFDWHAKKRIQKAYRNAASEIRRTLRSIMAKYPEGRWNYSDAIRFQDLARTFEEMRARLADLGFRSFRRLEDEIADAFRYASGYSAYQLDTSTPPNIGITFAAPPEHQVRALIDQPFEGARFSQKWGQVTNDMAAKLQQELTLSMIQGESIRDASKRVNRVVAGGMGRAETIARSELIRASTLGKDLVMGQNQDLLDEEHPKEIIITDDDRLCFAPSVMVRMDGGREIPIADVRPGMMVSTPSGARRVVNTIQRPYAGAMTIVAATNGRSLATTADHPIWSRRWTRADRLRSGSQLEFASKKSGEVLGAVHLRFLYAGDLPAFPTHLLVMTPVGGHVPVVVGAVDLQDGAWLGKGEVNTDISDLLLLHKRNVHALEGQTHPLLQTALSPVAVLAGSRTKASAGGSRKSTEPLPAVPTCRVHRRPSALLGAVATGSSLGVEGASAARALAVRRLGASALDGARGVALRDRTRDRESLLTDVALLGHPAPRSFVARPRAERALHDAGPGSESALALLARHGGMDSSRRVVATAAAERAAIGLAEALAALGAATRNHGLDLLQLCQQRQSIVYDIEVEDVHCFYANGILVHNCPICEAVSNDDRYRLADRDGLFLMPDGRRIAGPPIHPRCRCNSAPRLRSWSDLIDDAMAAPEGDIDERMIRNPETGKNEIVDIPTYEKWSRDWAGVRAA